MKNNRKIQIGVIGSMWDSQICKDIQDQAQKLGQEIAKENATLLFGFEGDFSSIPLIAAQSAHQFGGDTIAFIWGNHKHDLEKLNSQIIVTGQQRGGGREFSLILSSDIVISLGGGSGTLMEMAMAYQANIPIIAINTTGGWSEKLADKFLDERQRLKIIGVNNIQKAVKLAISLVKEKSENI